MGHDAALEPPPATLSDQLAFVTAGRQPAALAVPGDEDEEIGSRPRPIAPAADLGGDVGDQVAKLRPRGALRGKSLGKGADRAASSDLPDDRAFEHSVSGEAIDDRRDIAPIERGRVAHEQIADREAV